MRQRRPAVSNSQQPTANSLLGAHVSTQGGVVTAPARGRAIGATAIQVFTKNANQWREPLLPDDAPARFRAELARHGIRAAVSHDSYLINLASPDPALRRRSEASFVEELRRSEALGLQWVVSHPGNFIDDRAAGLRRNAESYARCLAAAPGNVGVAIETTAGCGTAIGSTFEELRALVDLMPAKARERVAFCADTCHLHVAGYDLNDHFDAVWHSFDRFLGLQRLVVMHLNDSKTGMGSRLDRHELIGEGRIGPEPFRRIMREPRFERVIKILETPKGDDLVTFDRRMMRRLKAYARGGAPARKPAYQVD